MLGKDADDTGVITTNPGSASFVQQDGDKMLLVAYPADYSWAAFRLNSGAFSFNEITFQLQIANVQKLWIGVADYDAADWRWQAYDPGDPRVDVSGFNAVSPLGNAYVVFVVGEDINATIEQVAIEVDVPEWVAYPVSTLPRMGQRHGLALVDGTPAVIAQQRQTLIDNNLLYFHTNTAFPAGPTDWTQTEVQAGLFDGVQALELIEQQGPVPGFAVSYGGTSAIWYAYANSTQPTGSGDWNYSFVANNGNEELALANLSGNPGLAFENSAAGGGTKVEYAWSIAAQPLGTDWRYYSIADSGDPVQNYGGVSLCELPGGLPGAVYLDYTASEFVFFSATQPEITDPGQTSTTLVDDPPLGGAYNSLITWQGQATLVYEQLFWVPRLARAEVVHPSQPEDFGWHHDLWDGAMDSPAMAGLGSALGVVWRDFNNQSVWFAWFDGQPGDAAGPADWKVVQVEPRVTSGDLCIVVLPGNLPGLTYYVDADTQLYFTVTTALP